MPPPKSKPRSATAGYTKTTRTDAKGRIIWKSKSGDDKVRCKSTSGANVGKMTWRKPVTKPAGAKGKAAPRKRKVGGYEDFNKREEINNYNNFKDDPTNYAAFALGIDVKPEQVEGGNAVFNLFTYAMQKLKDDSTSGKDFLVRLLGMLDIDVSTVAKAQVDKTPTRWKDGGGSIDDFEAGLRQQDTSTTTTTTTARRVKGALTPMAAARVEIRKGNMTDEAALDLAYTAWDKSEPSLRLVSGLEETWRIYDDMMLFDDMMRFHPEGVDEGTSGGSNGGEVTKKIFSFLFAVLLGLTAGSLFRLFFVWKDISIHRFTESKLNIAAFHYTQKFGMILGFMCRGAVCGIFIISSAVTSPAIVGIILGIGSVIACGLMFGKTTFTKGWVSQRIKR